jgi:hypothetical protein
MHTRLWLLTALALSASCSDEKTGPEVVTSGTLTLVRERSLSELLPTNGHYEASGIALRKGMLRVVFDNSTRVADVDLMLSAGTLGPGGKADSQYEGITIATRPASMIYVVKEIGAGGRGMIVSLDDQGALVATEPTDTTFSGDKGLEGIAWLDDIERLLVLCEEGSCGAGDTGPGHGLLKALRHESGSWVTETTLALPALANFDDYSDVAVLPEPDGTYRIAVLSQETSALWLGALTTRPLAISGPGVVYGFPKAAAGLRYCSLEGVTFIDRTTFAIASDRHKDDRGCSKGESVHVFALP